jgi:hypothetical protein
MSLFTSREDDMLMSGNHVALLSNLGILAKSQAHASLLHSTLRTAGNTHAQSRAPANVHSMIERIAASGLDREAERKFGERKKALERQREKRAQSDKGGNDCDFSKLHARLKSVLKSGASNADDILAALRNLHGKGRTALAKAQPAEWSEPTFESRYGVSGLVAQAVGVKAIRAAVKPSTPAKPVNTIASGFARINSLLKSMGLEAGYGTDCATLTGGSAIRKQSLPAKPLSPDELLKAASTLLHHGRIDTQTAARMQSEVNLTGKVSPALMKTLSEACK